MLLSLERRAQRNPQFRGLESCGFDGTGQAQIRSRLIKAARGGSQWLLDLANSEKEKLASTFLQARASAVRWHEDAGAECRGHQPAEGAGSLISRRHGWGAGPSGSGTISLKILPCPRHIVAPE